MKHAAAFAILCILPATAASQVTPPRPGVELPKAYLERIAVDKNAYQFEKAWIGKARRAKEARTRLLSKLGGGGGFDAYSFEAPQETMVAGTIQVPVILTKFSNTGADPYPRDALQQKLFDDPSSGMTVTDLYDEMSYGNLNMIGTVYPTSGSWVLLDSADTYYEGGVNGLSPCQARTGELIMQAITATDPTVDFGIYDNDGPDGLPNSGDDDGFVDVLAIAHPEVGGECGTTNMWAHRWVVGGWRAFGAQYVGACNLDQLGTAYSTNDARTGGGTIKIWDYVIVPAKGAGNGCGDQIVEIGVFCHEFGHAFGLPDLYDTDGGGAGIGAHGLMGSGNWNQPTNPAHMSAWSKAELGWITPVQVGPVAQTYGIGTVNLNPTAYQLNVDEKKFRRDDFNPVAGSWSLICGLDATEAGARNWPTGAGYGNGWKERVERDFVYNGGGPVTLRYDVFYQLEQNFDYGRIKIDVNGSVTQLEAFTGVGVVTARSTDLTPYLSGTGAMSYTIIFEFESDDSWSDEDGQFNAGTPGPFKLDNISVTGGGENYTTDFEIDDGGWICTTPPREFFLVENRSKAGTFDQFLHAEGLFIWHIEQNVAHSILGNTGGSRTGANLRPAGVTLMEADGFRQLLTTSQRGDAGDVFPGTTNNRTFDNTTSPDSKSHNLLATNVAVRSIGNPGSVISASLQGGEVVIPNTTPTYPLKLIQNEPNPFVTSRVSDTAISFSLPIRSPVSLNIFDVTGRLVTTLVEGVRSEGPHQITWNGTNARGEPMASGVYFYQLRAGGQSASRKLILVR